MRRFLATALLALFSFSLIAPALFASDPEANLPACCRKLGKHHCGMGTEESGPQFKGIGEKCPNCPNGATVTGSQIFLFVSNAHSADASPTAHALLAVHSESFQQSASFAAHNKRGPPAPAA